MTVRRNEQVVSGLNAALAVARHRPESIVRVLFHRDRRMDVGLLLKAAAAQRRQPSVLSLRLRPAGSVSPQLTASRVEGARVASSACSIASLR